MDIDDTFNTFYIDLEVDGLTEEQSVFIADETSNTFGPDSVYIIETSEKLSGNSFEKLENERSETHLSLVSSNLQPKDRNTLYSKKTNVSFNEFLQREKSNDICQHGEMSDVGTEHKSMLETMWYFGELYFALSYIWNKKAITKIRTFCDFRDIVGDNYIDKRAVTVGSVAEGLYEPTSSFGIIFILKWIKVVTDIPEKMLSEVHFYISIDKDLDYPGYCFLTVHSGFEYELISNCVKRKGQSFHLSSRLFKLFLMGENANSSSNSNCSLSLTYALGPCEIGNLWTFISSKNRKFITEYLKLKLMRLGVLLIPEGHPRSTARDLQWRISFDLQEKMLNINNKQMYADLRYRQFLILVGTHTDAMSGWILLGFHFLQLGWFNSCLNIVAYVEVLKKEYWLLNTGVSNYTAMDIHEYRKLLRLTRCSFMKMLKRLCKQPVLVPEASSLIPSECVFQEDINFIHIPLDVITHYLKFLCMAQNGNINLCPEILIQAMEASQSTDITEDMKRVSEQLFATMERILHDNL
ncbi:unnamed protein product [Mytilus edulis]|uniref:Mab-21-like HhH/H2TH-like domain-containing protein n=1 Tax=Mytilus edulis TaxID=6550 RepID=A0A8S3TU57_MYTED|nr:unnamed protein product [Mytilus edulis]